MTSSSAGLCTSCISQQVNSRCTGASSLNTTLKPACRGSAAMRAASASTTSGAPSISWAKCPPVKASTPVMSARRLDMAATPTICRNSPVVMGWTGRLT